MKIDDLVDIESLQGVELELSEYTWEWCKLPYPNHPYGCPNYGKKEVCPPCPKINEIMSEPYMLVAIRFDLESWSKHMKNMHPTWTDRQCRNLLYWQKGVLSRLKKYCDGILNANDNMIATYVPEALGVQVFNTVFKYGIKLERNPKKYVYKIAILGFKK